MYAKNDADQITNKAINDCINKRVKNNVTNDLLYFRKNDNNEIVIAEYRLKQLYNVLDVVSKELYEMLNKGDKIIFLPLGMISNNVFLSNLGPRIPIRIQWLKNIFTNLKTKVISYGINNALVEVYITININQEIMIPFNKMVEKRNYEILISSYFINGKVPSVYGKEFEINSSELKK